ARVARACRARGRRHAALRGRELGRSARGRTRAMVLTVCGALELDSRSVARGRRVGFPRYADFGVRTAHRALASRASTEGEPLRLCAAPARAGAGRAARGHGALAARVRTMVIRRDESGVPRLT